GGVDLRSSSGRADHGDQDAEGGSDDQSTEGTVVHYGSFRRRVVIIHSFRPEFVRMSYGLELCEPDASLKHSRVSTGPIGRSLASGEAHPARLGYSSLKYSRYCWRSR